MWVLDLSGDLKEVKLSLLILWILGYHLVVNIHLKFLTGLPKLLSGSWPRKTLTLLLYTFMIFWSLVNLWKPVKLPLILYLVFCKIWGFRLTGRKLSILHKGCFFWVCCSTHTVQCSMSSPEIKLMALKSYLLEFSLHCRASKRQLQVLAEKLNWACRIFYGGRTFLRRILDLMNPLNSANVKLKLNAELYADLSWWISFLAVFNGKYLSLDRFPTTDSAYQLQRSSCYCAGC